MISKREKRLILEEFKKKPKKDPIVVEYKYSMK